MTLKNQYDQRALILLYHRVCKEGLDPWSLSVAPHHFAEHLEVLLKYARPCRLEQLVQKFFNGSLPDRSVAITFDDGYSDNFHNAKPALEHYSFPATVFISSGYVVHNRNFWWDELAHLLLCTSKLPEVLCLKIGGYAYNWDLRIMKNYNSDSIRLQLCYSIHNLLKSLEGDERQETIDKLQQLISSKLSYCVTPRPLSVEEVASLVEGDLIEVGAHTKTHPDLPALPLTSQVDEILKDKAQLEGILDHRVNGFSYPFGRRSTDTVSIVKEAGFTYGCATSIDSPRQLPHPFELPRVKVLNWDGETFARQLAQWFSQPK